MKRIVLALAAVAVVGAAAPALAPPAFAQGARASDWQPLAQRQDDIARQIAVGEDSGSLTKLQAADLRDQFKGLLNLEDTYRKTGLTLHQREDLQARYDTLVARIRLDKSPADLRYAPAGVTDGRAPVGAATTTTVITQDR